MNTTQTELPFKHPDLSKHKDKQDVLLQLSDNQKQEAQFINP